MIRQAQTLIPSAEYYELKGAATRATSNARPSGTTSWAASGPRDGIAALPCLRGNP